MWLFAGENTDCRSPDRGKRCIAANLHGLVTVALLLGSAILGAVLYGPQPIVSSARMSKMVVVFFQRNLGKTEEEGGGRGGKIVIKKMAISLKKKNFAPLV